MSLDGKIGIVRYGKIFRGDKAAIAEKFGLCGLLIYSDPADYQRGPSFPDGEWLPDSGVQRGTLWRGTGTQPSGTHFSHRSLPLLPCSLRPDTSNLQYRLWPPL